MSLEQTSQIEALGISFRSIVDKDGRREIVFQSHVPQDTTPEQLNALLDKMDTATRRIAAKAELEFLQAERIKLLEQVATFEQALAELDAASQARWEESGKTGTWDPKRLPPADRQSRENTKGGIERNKKQLVLLREHIAELTTKVNGHGTTGAADNQLGLPDF